MYEIGLLTASADPSGDTRSLSRSLETGDYSNPTDGAVLRLHGYGENRVINFLEADTLQLEVKWESCKAYSRYIAVFSCATNVWNWSCDWHCPSRWPLRQVSQKFRSEPYLLLWWWNPICCDVFLPSMSCAVCLYKALENFISRRGSGPNRAVAPNNKGTRSTETLRFGSGSVVWQWILLWLPGQNVRCRYSIISFLIHNFIFHFLHC
jgi:hypothetical protein